jgi:integrase
MWKQGVAMQVNPITLVKVKGGSKRIRKPRVLTVEQFRLLISHLREPFTTLALMCVCFGLRISEALALKWADVDWLNGTLRVERGIVQQVVDDVKTDDSRKTLTISADLLTVPQVSGAFGATHSGTRTPRGWIQSVRRLECSNVSCVMPTSEQR